MPTLTCPICGSAATGMHSGANAPIVNVSCPRCEEFAATWELHALRKEASCTRKQAAVASHAVRRMQRPGASRPLIDTATWTRIVENQDLPSPAAQAEHLILYLGNTLEGPGEMTELDASNHGALIGSLDHTGFLFVVHALRDQGMVEIIEGADGVSATLSFNGWQEYERLRRGVATGHKAFMAMSFHNADLRDIFLNHFKPAAQRAGFNLIRLDEEPRAGSIDDRLRVEIRASRFVVADLTDVNPGAYWEAGYAEGLGKPVIYTCDNRVWRDQGTHFDTSHFHTVIWDVDDPAAAGRQLLATIRATLPDDSRFGEDDEDSGPAS